MIIKGKDKAKGFIAFENRAQIYWKSNIIEAGYTIKQCKGQYVGMSTGRYYKFESKPAMFEFEELFNVYKPDETEWEPIYIEASEFLWEEKNPLKYALCNAFDGNSETSFVENTEDDLFEISVHTNEFNPRIAIINGYTLNKNLYYANNRIKKINYDYLLEDNNLNYQYINAQANSRIWVKEIYFGNKYNDTCISELNFKFKNSNWLFGDIDE